MRDPTIRRSASVEHTRTAEGPAGQGAPGSGAVLPIPSDWLEEFEAAARRPLALRMRYAFIRTYKPVLDDAPYRSFDTMEEYRSWCQENMPSGPDNDRV